MAGDRVGAVIVNFNAGEHLVRCVRSLRAEGLSTIVVVDNASSDGSLEAAAGADPALVLVRTGANLGFGAGANRGAARVEHELILVCNPDIETEANAVKELVAALDRDPGAGIVGPRIENTDGTVYPSPRTFPALGVAVGHAFLGLVMPRNRYTRRYRMLDADRTRSASAVDWVSGSCFLVRASTWRDLGGFDEAYFMYAEDVDLCWRAGRAGWRTAFEPAARVVHAQGVSTDQHPYRMIAAHHRSLLRFSAQTMTGVRRVLLPFVATGLALRGAISCAQRAFQGRRAR